MKIKVRWLDGFCRELDCVEYQPGEHNYWFLLKDGRQKWIPRENVRSITVDLGQGKGAEK